MTRSLSACQILDTPMPENDANAFTVRGYLVALLAVVWDEGGDFSGKRPFGNSGWTYDLYGALAKAGHIEGTFDEDGYVNDVDTAKGRELISAAIQALADEAPAVHEEEA